MSKALIISGGNIKKEEVSQITKINNFKYIIAVDRGLEIVDELNILPTHIIGDFDSVNKEIFSRYENKNIPIHRLNPEKDDTDTHMAFKLAVELGSGEVVILGAIGSRMDHTISNIHIMAESLKNDIEYKIIDEYSEITAINKDTEIEKDDKYQYISLMPLTNEVKGVTLEGFKYKLENSNLKIGDSIGVSNEQVTDKAMIKLKEGTLLVIKSRD